MDRNIESVDAFYNLKYSEYSRRLKHVVERITPLEKLSHISEDEIEDIVDVLLSLRSQFRKLQWYAEVNKRGFVKILKKLDKKLNVHIQTKVLGSKVFTLGLANGNALDDKLAIVNNYLSEVAPYTLENSSALGGSATNGSSNPMVGPAQSTEQIIKELDNKTGIPRRLSSTSIASSLNDNILAEFKSAIMNDDAEALEKIRDIPQKALLSGLSKALSCNSRKCVLVLLNRIESLDGPTEELNGRNAIHRYIINHGRHVNQTPPFGAVGDKHLPSLTSDSITPSSLSTHTPALQQRTDTHFINPAELPTKLAHALSSDGALAKDEDDLLVYLLNNLKPSQRSALLTRDQYLRTPLHYAAHYGLKVMTKAVVDYINKWELWKLSGEEWLDSDGMNPLQLAVAGNHPKTTSELFTGNVDIAKKWIEESNGQLLHIAARLGSAPLIQTLLDFDNGFNDINAVDENNETALFVASKLNKVESVRYLVERGADTEIGEATYGWTPVIVAAVDGYDGVAKVLLDAGCDIDRADGSGWTAMEHACLRGHIDLARMLTPKHSPWVQGRDSSPTHMMLDDLNNSTSSLASTKKFVGATSVKSGKDLGVDEVIAADDKQEAVLTFGHRCLDRTMILVTLGGTDVRKSSNPVTLDQVPYSRAHSTQLDTALSLVLSSSTGGERLVYDLPIPDDGHATEPVAFYLDKNQRLQDVKLYFDLVPTYAGNQTKKVGRAVALLGSVLQNIGHQTRSLNQTITLPFIESETLEVLGTVNFEILVVTPFTHPQMTIEKSSTYWKSLITTRVIGHRGLGKNSTSKKSLQLGENTLESFIQAANLGASYVEFDVQLTKDHVPVIYHDFLVGESGIDVPMHDLTLEQFMGMSRPKVRSGTPSSKPRSPSLGPISRSPDYRHRSMSLFDEGDDEYAAMAAQMRYTRDFKLKGFKGNFRGHSIQSPFTTLEEVFKTLPKNVGFNIECKYPMLDESEAEDMQAIAIELNVWVDTVLKCVYDHADGRDIIFSSFHPDICLMLSLKQPTIPVLFLSESGTAPMKDVRATSLQEAIRFSRRWNLLGIVSECKPLILCPRLVNVVKESGLVCMSYGADNNDPVNARLQMMNGVDAVIVDSVLAVRKGLTTESS